MHKRTHDETPKAERRPLKVLKPSSLNSPRGPLKTLKQPNILNSPRVIAAGVLKNDKPVMNCSFENVKPVTDESRQRINKLVQIMDRLKAQIPAHEDFIEKCKEQSDDYQALLENYEESAKQHIEQRDKPITVKNIEPCVPILAKEILDNFIKQKLKIDEPNTELEEELIIVTQRHEKLMAANNSMATEIANLIEEFDNEIEAVPFVWKN